MEERIYKKMYLHLFNTVTKVLEDFDNDPAAAYLLLSAAQLDCENMYMSAGKKPACFLLKRGKRK